MSRVAVTGHLCVDLTPRASRLPLEPGRLTEIGPLTVSLGGSVANTGGALASFGHDVTISTRVGDDDLGAIASSRLARTPGIGGSPTVTVGESTSYSIVLEPDGADRSFWHHVGANASFDGTETEVEGFDLMHLGYPSLLPRLVDADGQALRTLLTRAKASSATTSIDLAVVDQDSPIDWMSILSAAMPLIDVISPSADDLRSALHAPRATADELVDLLLSWGAGIAAVSDGSRGIVIGAAESGRLRDGGLTLRSLADPWGDARIHQPANPLRHRTTTNGAGDAATAGLISSLLRAETPAAAGRRATAAAASIIEGETLAARPTEVAIDGSEGML